MNPDRENLTKRMQQSMTDSAGYSGTSLARKLGIKPGSRVRLEGAPEHYPLLLAPLPAQVVVSSRITTRIDIWHLFASRRTTLTRRLPEIDRKLADDAMLWVSWYKKSSPHYTDITEDTIRELALPLQLVDVKVCAVDEDWSALKLVRRVVARGKSSVD